MRFIRAVFAAACALLLAWLWSGGSAGEQVRWAMLLPVVSVACIALLWE